MQHNPEDHVDNWNLLDLRLISLPQTVPRGFPLAIPLALVPLLLPRPPLVADAFVPRLLVIPEVGRAVAEAELVFFKGFLADAGLSKKEVSVVLSRLIS